MQYNFILYGKMSKDRPCHDRNGESLHGTEKLDGGVLEHGVGPEPDHEFGSPDHWLLAHIFLHHLLPHLNANQEQ